MTLSQRHQHIRALLDTLGERKRGFRYPQDVKRHIIDFVHQEMSQGATFSSLVDLLGIGPGTLAVE